MDRVITPMWNTVSRLTLGGGLLVGGLSVAIAFVAAQGSLWSTRVGAPPEQPVPFSHAHHVGALGIDCLYCHTSAGESAFAGLPTSETCMHCHAQLYTTAELLEPIRASWRTGRPVAWRRVHDLPDFVFFHHAAHVDAGVSCATCHGDVGRMPLTWQAEPMDMEWCLSCHRAPHVHHLGERRVPSERSGPLNLERGSDPLLTDCTACHR